MKSRKFVASEKGSEGELQVLGAVTRLMQAHLQQEVLTGVQGDTEFIPLSGMKIGPCIACLESVTPLP